jgi:hypothetical protein
MNLLQSLFKPTQINKVGFEDMKLAIHSPNYCIINTLPLNSQDCLIHSTISYLVEEKTINDLISSYHSTKTRIIVYGQNAQDDSGEKKVAQLIQLGLENVSLYSGGLFEWILLQDIYGQTQFPTTTTVVDILRFR